MLALYLLTIVGWLIAGPAVAQPTTATETATAPAVQSTACGEIVNSESRFPFSNTDRLLRNAYLIHLHGQLSCSVPAWCTSV